jgi:ketosteroid isomerase-like protein
MDRKIASCVLVLAGLSVACSPRSVDVEAEGAALMQVSRDWSDLVATGDIDAVLEGWAEDAVFMPPGAPILQGHTSIGAFLRTVSALPGFSISWVPVDVHVAASGDMAYMIERNVMTINDSLGNPVTTYGKGITVWTKDANGDWKNVADIWNEGLPPTQH